MDSKQIPWVPVSEAVKLQASQTPSCLKLRPATGSLPPSRSFQTQTPKSFFPQNPTFQSASPALLTRLLDFLRFFVCFYYSIPLWVLGCCILPITYCHTQGENKKTNHHHNQLVTQEIEIHIQHAGNFSDSLFSET